MGLGDNPLGFGGWDKGTWGLAKKHPSSIALVPFLELQAIQIWRYKRPNFGGTSDPSPILVGCFGHAAVQPIHVRKSGSHAGI